MYMYTNQQHVLNLCNRHETISMYIFLDCLPGYYKTNCSDPCRYPSYGLRCQKECNCPEKSCHHVFGCPDHRLDGKISLRKKTERGIFTSIYKYIINKQFQRFRILQCLIPKMCCGSCCYFLRRGGGEVKITKATAGIELMTYRFEALHCVDK